MFANTYVQCDLGGIIARWVFIVKEKQWIPFYLYVLNPEGIGTDFLEIVHSPFLLCTVTSLEESVAFDVVRTAARTDREQINRRHTTILKYNNNKR